MQQRKTSAIIPAAGDYFPLSAGSFWNYKWYAKDVGLIKVTHSTEANNMDLLNFTIF